MRIGDHSTDERVLVVAEIGNNHEGDPAVARELVERAAEAGVHAVKVQVFETRRFIAPSQPERIEQLDRFRLEPEVFAELAELARARGIGFVATALDLASADLLEPIVDAFKIASGDNDVAPLLERAAASGRPVIVSTGMSSIEDVARAKEVVERRWQADGTPGELALLHCVSAYPAPSESAALATIPALAARFGEGATIGYSDHTLGLEACTTAVALGARILEKHVTLRHDFSAFRDHQLSAEPHELAELVARVAEVERLVGTPRTEVLPIEEPVAAAARRSVYAARELPEGHVLAGGDLTWMRPPAGLPARDHDALVGRALARPLAAHEVVEAADLR